MYRIFKNDCSIILTSNGSDPADERILPWSEAVLEDFLLRAEDRQGEELIFYSADLDDLWERFQRQFKVIAAAGGMVKNSRGEVLFIFRHGTWDLPKGKIDQGESVEEAALREVIEECGFASLTLVRKLPSTYHIYTERESQILKVTHWFEMYSDDSDLSPQTEEGITELRWIRPQDRGQVMANTYPNIALLIDDQASTW